jgi:predicted nucleotide-binding protein (sugar kinase/HSP70/actin superfamily)
LPCPYDLSALAAPVDPPALRGGMGHLEAATFLRVERDHTADLVVSIKPFGCMPSSAISDGVVHALARSARTGFVSVETVGDGEAQLESRLELALESARGTYAEAVPLRERIPVDLEEGKLAVQRCQAGRLVAAREVA